MMVRRTVKISFENAPDFCILFKIGIRISKKDWNNALSEIEEKTLVDDYLNFWTPFSAQMTKNKTTSSRVKKIGKIRKNGFSRGGKPKMRPIKKNNPGKKTSSAQIEIAVFADHKLYEVLKKSYPKDTSKKVKAFLVSMV